MGNILARKDMPKDCFEYSDLYSSHPVTIKAAKKMIRKGRIAPLFTGKDGVAESVAEFYEECPICFLQYSGGLNRLLCCKHSICSECYLHLSSELCPFCNQPHAVKYVGPLSEAERKAIKDEEDQTLRLEEKARRDSEIMSKRQLEERRKQLIKKAQEQREINDRNRARIEEEEVRQVVETSNNAADLAESEMIRYAIALSLRETNAR